MNPSRSALDHDSQPPSGADPSGRAELVAEYEFCRRHAGLADLSPRGRVRIGGKDRVRFLNNTCTNDISKLATGKGREAFFLDAKGRILFISTIFAGVEAHWIDVDPGQADALMQHLDRYIVREDVQLANLSNTQAQLHLVGPEAIAVLLSFSAEVGTSINATPENLDHWVCDLIGVECQVRRHDRAPLPGFDLLMPKDRMEDIRKTLLTIGGERVRAIGEQSLDAMRIEAGIPVAGREIGEDSLPQELGRNAQAISFNKGCYIGQETVARLDAMGHVNRLLRGLTYAASGPAPIGASIKAGDKTIGRLGSSAYSPRFDSFIALAVLRTAAGSPDANVAIETTDGPVEARVCAVPM